MGHAKHTRPHKGPRRGIPEILGCVQCGVRDIPLKSLAKDLDTGMTTVHCHACGFKMEFISTWTNPIDIFGEVVDRYEKLRNPTPSVSQASVIATSGVAMV